MRKSKVHYTVAAENDLDAIAAYTLHAWGASQRDFYLELLEAACEDMIPRHLHLSRAVPGYAQLRSWRVEHHVVDFRSVRGGIEIVRLLHERQLPARHLKR